MCIHTRTLTQLAARTLMAFTALPSGPFASFLFNLPKTYSCPKIPPESSSYMCIPGYVTSIPYPLYVSYTRPGMFLTPGYKRTRVRYLYLGTNVPGYNCTRVRFLHTSLPRNEGTPAVILLI